MPCSPARIQYASIFNRHLVGFVGFLFSPVDCLVRAGELADTAELPSVEVPEPAVCAALGPVQLGYNDPPSVGFFPIPENLIRADLCTEVAALAPPFINLQSHGMVLCCVYVNVLWNCLFAPRAISAKRSLPWESIPTTRGSESSSMIQMASAIPSSSK